MKPKLLRAGICVLAGFSLTVWAAPGSSMESDWMPDICRDGLGGSWVGCANGDLNRNDWEAGVFPFQCSRLRDPFRLSSAAAGAVCEDSSGLSRGADGNQGSSKADFNFGALLRKGRDSQMHSGGSDDALALSAGNLRTNRYPPDVVASAPMPIALFPKFISGGQTLARVSFNDPERAAAVNFSAPTPGPFEAGGYRYQPTGFDSGGLVSEGHGQPAHANLPPGKYRLMLQGSNRDGIWSTGAGRLQLLVAPPFWQTSWVYPVYGLVLLTLVWGRVRSQHRKLEAEKAHSTELEEQIQRQTQEFEERHKDLRAVNNQLKEFCLRDPLTGLRNRRYLEEFLDTETASLERSLRDLDNKRNPRDGSSLQPKMFFMMIDLDGFKTINDDYGHHVGDQALLQVADILRKCARKSDRIIRWGGDEFLLVGQCSGPPGAEKLAERVRFEIRRHHFWLGHGYESRLSASIGLGLYPFVPAAPNLVSWGQVIEIADQASYLAKETRKDAWVAIYSTDKTSHAEPIRTLKADIKPLLQQGVVEVKTSIEGDFPAAVAASAGSAN